MPARSMGNLGSDGSMPSPTSTLEEGLASSQDALKRRRADLDEINRQNSGNPVGAGYGAALNS